MYRTDGDEVAGPGSLFKCNRCGHIWVSRKADGIPNSCPKCRSVIWNKDCRTVRCLRCDHEWTSTKEHPGRCPKCHTARWDTPVAPAAASPVCTSKVILDPVIVEHVRHLHSEGKTALQIACETGISYQSTRAIIDRQSDINE